MLHLQSVGTFLPLINPVADDFVQHLFKIRDQNTGVVDSLYNELAKWNLECEFRTVNENGRSASYLLSTRVVAFLVYHNRPMFEFRIGSLAQLSSW